MGAEGCAGRGLGTYLKRNKKWQQLKADAEAVYEVVDRGYDQQFTFFMIKDGKTTIIYSNYNGNEEWNNSDEGLEILEALKE